jgi:hypothetical protein
MYEEDSDLTVSWKVGLAVQSDYLLKVAPTLHNAAITFSRGTKERENKSKYFAQILS